ncbi:ATP-dependent DNA helicase Rep [Streptomyces antimycoticus]
MTAATVHLFPQGSAPGAYAATPRDADAVLDGLDPEQREVATSLHGAVCVLAGAGTGKTRAITHRIAYGVRAGMLQPASVLAVTFTNRAAGEMRGRLRQLGAGGAAGAHASTRRPCVSCRYVLAQGRSAVRCRGWSSARSSSWPRPPRGAGSGWTAMSCGM